jgi:hypothetical protein
MAIKVIPFEPWHMDWLHVQPAQAAELAKVPAFVKRQLAAEESWTVADGERFLMCGGVIPIGSDCRALVWTFMGGDIGRKQFLELHNKVRKYIRGLKYPRLEMEVADGFKAGHRWARLLGFKPEPLGNGRTLYVRFR